MKHLFLFILITSTLKVAGQNHFIGVKGGASRTNITSSNFVNQHDYRPGFTAGLTYEYLLKRHFTVGADLIHTQRGFTNDIVFTDKAGNPTGEKHTSKFNYDYTALPVKAGLNVGSTLYGFANMGVIPSLLGNARTTTPTIITDGKVTGNETFDVTSRVSEFDLAGLVEIGGGYKIRNRYWVFAAAEYQRSFTTITNSTYFADSKIRHNGMALTMGLKCALTKE